MSIHPCPRSPHELPRRSRPRGTGLWRWLLLAGVAIGACQTRPAQAADEPRAARPGAAARESVPRLFPPSEGPDVNVLGVERDGTRRLVVFGLRALARPSGALEVAREFLPASRNIQVLSLPERLGGGFLFWVVVSRKTELWKASSFTGPLEPFAELDFEAERLVPGFDRLYVRARNGSDWFALDAESGAGLGRGNLPVAPSHGELSFADEWFGAAEVPARGVLVSFDAGSTWHPLERPYTLEGEAEGALILSANKQRYLLDAQGNLLADGAGTGSAPKEFVPVQQSRFAGLGSALGAAILRGHRESDGANPHAIVALRGALARVKLSDGSVLDMKERPELRDSECTALPLGKSFGFICQSLHNGDTRLFGYKSGLNLELLKSFVGPRSVVASGNGGLVVRGDCNAKLAATALRSGVYCVRTPAGTSFEVVIRGGDSVAPRVVALSDGTAAVLVPPQARRKGSLSVVTASGKSRTVPLKLFSQDPRTRELFETGFWLETWTERSDAQLGGWVTTRGGFAGVRVLPDGTVKFGPVRRGIERALLGAERGLWVPSTGGAEETSDGGMSYRDVELPLELSSDAAKAATLSGLEQGCSALGCVYAGWAHIASPSSAESPRLGVAASPKSAKFPAPGGGRWLLRCSLTGEASKPALLSKEANSEDSGSPAWASFIERPAPARAQDTFGFNVGGEGGLLRAYAWAPRGADFRKVGRFSVSVLDRYRTTEGVWSTAPAPSPWPDSAQVSELFGYDGATPSAWRIFLDPAGRAGVLSVSVRGNTELLAVEENLAPTMLVNASRQGVSGISSAVKLGTSYYVAAYEDPRTLRVFQLSEGRTKLLGRYTDLPEGRGVSMTLVRSTASDALGLWTRSGNGWYVFPLDLVTGRAGAPTEISSATLSRLPRSCAVDEEGYLLDGPVGVEPYVEFLGVAERVSAHGYTGRFVLGQRGICLMELSAVADGAIDRRLSPEGAPAAEQQRVPMTVLDRSERGRRWGFRCGN